MSYSTSQDLINQVLAKAGVLPDGQTPQAEDVANVTASLPLILETLAAREIVFVPDLDNIPSAWIVPLAYIIAYAMRTDFGITGEEAAEMKVANDENEGYLKAMTRGRPTGESLRIDYF